MSKRSLIATVAAALALFSALTSLASASPAGLQRVTRSSLNDSLPAKDRFAGCPTGTSVLGGGGRIFPSNGQVMLDGVTLDAPLGGVTARGFEDADGTSLHWQVDTFAVCANPLPGLHQVDAVSTESSNSRRQVVAQCPAGQQVVGAGAETDSGGEVAITSIAPSLTGVLAAGQELGNGTANTWTITAHAMCADPVPGLELRTFTGDSLSDNHGVVMSCPAGKKVLGMGGETLNGAGRVVLDDLTPSTTLSSVSVGAREIQGGTAASWSVKAFALCA